MFPVKVFVDDKMKPKVIPQNIQHSLEYNIHPYTMPSFLDPLGMNLHKTFSKSLVNQ